MPKTRSRLWLTLLVLGAACGGSEDRGGDPDGSLGSSGARPAERSGEPRERAETPAPAGVAPTDTGAWVIETPTGEPPAGERPNPHPWVAGESSGGTSTGTAPLPILLAVRTAAQDGYDRIVFEFDRHVPEWRMSYVDRPQYECGSGEAVRLEGDAWLEVSFAMANAHTEEGRPTNAPRHVADPAGANLRELRRTCDFEGQVQYVVGVASPGAYRAFQLSSPARLVVDLRM